MRNTTHYGPGLVVIAAATLAILAAPLAIRRANDAQADADIALASRVLSTNATITPAALAVAPPASELASSADREEAARALSQGDDTAPAPILEQLNRANRAIAKLVEPSVVHVSTLISMPRQMASPYGSSGSGWIWDDAGHIVTNAHVVEGAERLQVQLFDGELREAELVGLDLRTDIAVIKVSAGGLRPSLRGDSAKIEQGDLVYAFGSPFDFRFSMSSGIVSGLGRSAGLADIDYENFIQTDAAINPGNSGGPLTDIRGRVIGMNTAIATGRGNSVGQGQFAGIGLAIPMSMIESVVSQIIDSGEVRKGFLGVSVVSIDMARSLAARDSRFEAVAEGFRGEGAVVGDVTPDSPASEAGFREGDVIVTIDGQKVTSEGSVPAVVSSRRPGETVKFGVWRGDGEGGGKRIELSTKLAELDMSLRVGIDVPAIFERAGIAQFATATSERAAKLGVPYRRGILIEDLRDGSELDEMLDEGSVITAVFDQQVSSVDEFYTRLARVFPTGMRVRRSEFPVTIAQPDGRIVQILLSVR